MGQARVVAIPVYFKFFPSPSQVFRISITPSFTFFSVPSSTPIRQPPSDMHYFQVPTWLFVPHERTVALSAEVIKTNAYCQISWKLHPEEENTTIEVKKADKRFNINMYIVAELAVRQLLEDPRRAVHMILLDIRVGKEPKAPKGRVV